MTSTVWARATIRGLPLGGTGGLEEATRTDSPATADGTATGSTNSAPGERR
ncbi:hypothetical protein [Streptomyces sp. NPDC058964]|uniref:hypothetical protein n=1 Tax=Streptomyces sp. NPDC058964 TaxID=3346681 RepID=UPI0036873811